MTYNSKTFSVVMNSDLVDSLNRIAAQTGKSRNALVTGAIKRLVANWQDEQCTCQPVPGDQGCACSVCKRSLENEEIPY